LIFLNAGPSFVRKTPMGKVLKKLEDEGKTDKLNEILSSIERGIIHTK